MRHEEHVTLLGPEIARFVAVAEKADMAAPVPGCPEWDLAGLVRHMGHVHRWVTHIIESNAQSWVGFASVDIPKPEDPADLPAWLAAGAGPLLEALSGDPDAPVWGFGGNSRRWWSRRMLHETTVHRADAERTLGLEPEVDPDVAVDGIDEFLDLVNVISGLRNEPLRLAGSGETLHLHATDAPGEWTITFGPEGMTWERGHSKASTAVRGKVADLFLLMFNRHRVQDEERFQVFGDLGLAARWATNCVI
jgi:uncharacterized protein (TIGR03083 family)